MTFSLLLGRYNTTYYECTETVKLVWCIELCRSYVELLTNVKNAVQFLFKRQTRSLIQSIILKLVIVLEMNKSAT